MAAANLYEPPPPSYQAAQVTNNHFAGKFNNKKNFLFLKNLFHCILLETTMFVSPAQAPYEGVYQRQPTGLPRAEFIPQYPEVPSASLTNANNSAGYPPTSNGYQAPMQYPSQAAYQNNGFGGQQVD
jgi:hypothetical protein